MSVYSRSGTFSLASSAHATDSLLSKSVSELRAPSWLPTVFIILESVGAVGVCLLIATYLLSKNVRRSRHPVWLNMCITWLLSCIAYILLAFHGWQKGPEPPFDICLIQAALVYASPPMTACSAWALLVQLYVNINTLVHPRMQKDHPILATKIKNAALIITPYFIWIAVIVGCVLAGVNERKSVVRDTNPYCTISTGTPGRLSAIWVVLFVLITLGLEGIVVHIPHHSYWNLSAAYIAYAFHANDRSFKEAQAVTRVRPPVSLLIRIVIFTVFSVLVIGVSFLIVTPIKSTMFYMIVPNIFIALMPIAVCIIFGTSMDIMRAWAFWKPPLQDEDPWASSSRQRLDSKSSLEDMPDLEFPAAV
ncbi:hypothetical protein PUNSTDRAFT_144999 [Punctularia strigosozonata HHB-11173 SS5]|uniref:uncharacterized protein n=1 Tax=Punctularia strigosozonata (strain HHB-11173) TaxID=741275 RepID=UPI000441716D|nr:uncharacterized protein PUNSTDRAFT_144999 [Punctularia strigosozonata HHB-11173 SS5]EIN06372.1 hypothetical protein PUNSTDRAFT_144999 [Punctularia strigosozonata HHB-11173 SS5]